VDPPRILSTLALVLGALVLTTCRCEEENRSPVRVRTGAPRLVLDLKLRVASGAAGPGGIFVAGTPKGEVVLATPGKAPARVGEGRTHEGPVNVVQISGDGRRLLSIGGKTAALWDLQTRRLVRQVRGPQVITSGALHPDGRLAFFGTDQGHVLRWPLDRASAGGVKGFACGGTRVLPARMQLPEKERCPYGTYLEPPEGPPACLYPVTHLVFLPKTLARACRTGDGAILELTSRAVRYFAAGHLRTLTPVGPDLLLGRAEGQLRLYRPAERKVIRSFAPEGEPSAAASDGQLVAVAQRGAIRLWHRDHARPVAGPLSVDRRVVWLGLAGHELRALLEDGRVLGYRVTVAAAR
jgi:hypothetical protein